MYTNDIKINDIQMIYKSHSIVLGLFGLGLSIINVLEVDSSMIGLSAPLGCGLSGESVAKSVKVSGIPTFGHLFLFTI